MVGCHAEGLVRLRLQHCGEGCVLKKEVATATSVVVVIIVGVLVDAFFSYQEEV
jgi:hypothetical protein